MLEVCAYPIVGTLFRRSLAKRFPISDDFSASPSDVFLLDFTRIYIYTMGGYGGSLFVTYTLQTDILYALYTGSD